MSLTALCHNIIFISNTYLDWRVCFTICDKCSDPFMKCPSMWSPSLKTISCMEQQSCPATCETRIGVYVSPHKLFHAFEMSSEDQIQPRILIALSYMSGRLQYLFQILKCRCDLLNSQHECKLTCWRALCIWSWLLWLLPQDFPT